MEENSKNKHDATDSNSTKPNVFELKPEMELPDDNGNIIDLTQIIGGPETSQAAPESVKKENGTPFTDIEADLDAVLDDAEADDKENPARPLPPETVVQDAQSAPADDWDSVFEAADQDMEETQAADSRGEAGDDDAGDIIDLTESVADSLEIEGVEDLPAETSFDEDPGEDETMLELTEIVDSRESDTGRLPENDPGQQSSQDEVIELKEKVDAEEIARQLEVAKQMAFQDTPDEEIIQLTDVIKTARMQPVSAEPEIDEPAGDSMADRNEARYLPESDVESPADDDVALIQDELAETHGAVSREQVEAAIEKIIQTRYADTIERLIAQAVEKAVNSEIQSIKSTFMEDIDPTE
jgi:hypothetical protein